MSSPKLLSTGWGRSIRSQTAELNENIDELQKSIKIFQGNRGAIPVGLHRSYGDSALNSGGLQISTSKFRSAMLDCQSGLIQVGAGVSIRELESIALQKGFFPAIVPGTGFVTIGGAIAADIHGKSHHKTGSFSSIVKSIKVLYSDSSIRELQPTGPTSSHFWATVAGLGLTGVIVEAQLQLSPVLGNHFVVHEKRSRDLEQLLTDLKSADAEFDHTVAWIDISGKYSGRGVVGMGNFSTEYNKKFKLKTGQIEFPITPLRSLVTPTTVEIFNAFWYRKPLQNGAVGINAFTHPLDAIGSWNRVYGKQGFLQYQFAIPDGQEDFLFLVLSKLRSIGAVSFLGILKRFGKASSAALSFPAPGWTLALDFSVSIPKLEQTLNEFDAELVSRKGRVYLVKDSRLRAESLPEMYPRLEEWKVIRQEMDPQKLWNSDQGRRLELC